MAIEDYDMASAVRKALTEKVFPTLAQEVNRFVAEGHPEFLIEASRQGAIGAVHIFSEALLESVGIGAEYKDDWHKFLEAAENTAEKDALAKDIAKYVLFSEEEIRAELDAAEAKFTGDDEHDLAIKQEVMERLFEGVEFDADGNPMPKQVSSEDS